MRKLFVILLTFVLMLGSVPVLADSSWQIVNQVLDDGYGNRVGITVGAENADPNLMFAISDPVILHSDSCFDVSWEEPRLLVSNDCGKNWRQIKSPEPTSACDTFKFMPYFYKGKLRVVVNEYELHLYSFFESDCRLIKTYNYETTDGSSWSNVDEQEKIADYRLQLSQGDLRSNELGISLATNVKDYYAADEQTILYIEDDGTLHRMVIYGSNVLINGVKASSLVSSETSGNRAITTSELSNSGSSSFAAFRSKLSNSGKSTIAAVNNQNSQPLAISISKDNGSTWKGINCEMPWKVFGYNKNLRVFLTNNGIICVTDMSKTALITNDNGTSWKMIDLPKLTDRNYSESIQLINDSDTIIVFYVTREGTYRYEYKMEQKPDLKPAI